jgi:uncharacterized protein (TIGR02996 family)
LRAGARYGSCVLERQLHQGSVFDYWLANTDSGELVVVAVLLPYEGPRREMMAERIADRRAIMHPTIPRLLHVIEGEALALVYEYVPGVSVRTLLDRSGDRFPVAVAARIVERIARAIHEARIPPRWCSSSGIEPGCILIDPAGEPHLLLAPRIEAPSNVTGPGIIPGAVAYLAPEAIRGMPLLPQSTVFSLSVLLYELLAGSHPFKGGSLLETLQRIMNMDVQPIADLTSELDRVLMTAMSSAPEDRQVHAGELADQLRGASTDQRSIRDFARRWAEELDDDEFEQRDTVPIVPAREDEEASLLAAIEADRDAIDPYLVYADWLQSRGHPRGELIMLQHQQHLSTVQFLAEHPELLGELQPILEVHHLRFKTPDSAAHFLGSKDFGLEARWHLGFIESIRVVLTDIRIERVLRMFEQNEVTRFLRGLAIGPMEDNVYNTLAGTRLQLDSLFVGDIDRSLRSVHRATANVSAAFPSLKRLAIRGSEIHLGRLVLPQLRELRIYSGGLTADTINYLATSAIPKLEHLELHFGGLPMRDAWPDRVGALFDDPYLPNLRSLAIADREPNAVIGLLVVLSQSDLAKRLERLDLSGSAIKEEAAQPILENKERFPRLIEVRYSPSQKARSGPTSSIG